MKLTENQRKIIRIVAGTIFFIAALVLKKSELIPTLLFYIALIVIGGDIIIFALRNIIKGRVFDENFLMSLAAVGAFIIGDHSEGVAVMLFYQVGELFQSFAVNKSRRSIASLMSIRPDTANVLRQGELKIIEPSNIEVGEEIVIKPGERVPLDAIIIEGTTTLDTSALTGESMPRTANVGEEILSGCINLSGVITARVQKPFGESAVNRILELVEDAIEKKSDSEKFITKFARYYTPAVVVLALLLAVLPPLFIQDADFSEWLRRAFIFLVISCPCALVISIPLSFFGGIGGASRQGVLFKGANYIEALTRAEIAVFDKTGTLTKGVFEVQEVVPSSTNAEQLLMLAAYAEYYSNHPISESLIRAYGKQIEKEHISKTEEIAGHGVIATISNRQIAVGNTKLMRRQSVIFEAAENAVGTVIYVAAEDEYLGYIVIADEVKKDSANAVEKLKQSQIKKTVMLTGDSKPIGEAVAKKLGIDEVYTELLPEDKVVVLEKQFKTMSPKGTLVFVGDGINDAPALAIADIGIAMGALGSDAAIEAADVVLMNDEPSKVADAIAISKKTLRIVKQNIIAALGVKAVVMVLGAIGYASMWAAVFADVGVAFLAILNAMRMLSVKQSK